MTALEALEWTAVGVIIAIALLCVVIVTVVIVKMKKDGDL